MRAKQARRIIARIDLCASSSDAFLTFDYSAVEKEKQTYA